MKPVFTDLKVITDARGSLVAIESLKNVPFDMRRVYFIFGLSPSLRRGQHAHKKNKQVALCIKGQCVFLLDDGRQTTEVILESPTQGLLVNEMIWHEMFDFSSDCILMMIASDMYDELDYIRDYNEFLRMTKNVHSPIS